MPQRQCSSSLPRQCASSGGRNGGGHHASRLRRKNVGSGSEVGDQAVSARTRYRIRTRTDGPNVRRPKALIAWSSGKDSAWALHEQRQAGDYDIVGALVCLVGVAIIMYAPRPA